MTTGTTSRAYHGPVAIVTVTDAKRLLPLLRGRTDLADVAAKLRTAVGADPQWR